MDLEVARVHSCRQTEQNPPRQLRPATHDASIELLAQAFNRSCRKSTGARVPNRRPRSPRAQHPLRGCMPHCKLESVDRFYDRSALVAQRQLWKAEGKTVVFTNGCYDLLHPGHIRLLEQARSLGDLLILALNSDSSVRRMKGPSRPLISQTERAEMALALEAVDALTLFDEDTPRELIAEVLPDILVKGADWSHFIAGREEVEASGGKVVTLPLEPGYST